MTKRKKKIMLFHLIFWSSIRALMAVLLIAASIAYGSLHYLDGYVLNTEFKDYNGYSRVNGHGSKLTLRITKYGEESFDEQYPWISACYRYEYIGPTEKANTIQQIIFLSLVYDEENYKDALNDVQSQKPYSYEINFSYSKYDFNLNDDLYYDEDYTGKNNYDFEYDTPFINSILLVGHSDELNSLIFLGFYYEEYDNIYSFSREIKNYYNFTDWPTFFNDFYSFYSWSEN